VGSSTGPSRRFRGVACASVMGMSGAGGPRAERRRRMVAVVIVLAMLLAAGATVLAIVLG
jgi:uncharacterized membrane protein YccC